MAHRITKRVAPSVPLGFSYAQSKFCQHRCSDLVFNDGCVSEELLLCCDVSEHIETLVTRSNRLGRLVRSLILVLRSDTAGVAWIQKSRQFVRDCQGEVPSDQPHIYLLKPRPVVHTADEVRQFVQQCQFARGR